MDFAISCRINNEGFVQGGALIGHVIVPGAVRPTEYVVNQIINHLGVGEFDIIHVVNGDLLGFAAYLDLLA